MAAEVHRSTWRLGFGDEIDETLVVITPLGGGRRYEVFEAWDRTLFCSVAVKVVRPDRVNEEQVRSGLRREAELAEALAHPNLVRLLRWRADGPRPYLVFERVTAPTMQERLRDLGPLSLPDACLLGIRILAALHYLHSRSVLHLDVKPANVIVGDPPRLLDLSLSRRTDAPLTIAGAVGTAAYMAPEQCTHGTVTSAADLFGLGVTLYEAITGTRPFCDGDDDAPRIERRYPQLAEDPRPLIDVLPVVPAALERVVLACLAREPVRRPSAAEAALLLHAVLEELGMGDLAWPRALPIDRPPATA